MTRSNGLKSLILATGIGVFGGGILCIWSNGIQQAYITGDLNRDGTNDLVIETFSGLKIPLYGQKRENEVIYVRSEEMESVDPRSIIDYKSIRTKLNEK